MAAVTRTVHISRCCLRPSTCLTALPYRKCDKKITGNEEVCLYYHLHQCTAPCIGAVSHDEYMKSIKAASDFLSGKGDDIVKDLEADMHAAADELNFERAAELRDRLEAVNHVLERQKIVIDTGSSADVIGVSKGDGGDAGVQSAPATRQDCRQRVLPDGCPHRGFEEVLQRLSQFCKDAA